MTNHPASPRAHGRATASLLPLRLLSPKASGRARASLLPLLSLLSLLSLSSLFPLAARAEDYPLWIGGVQFTAGNLVIDADDDPGIASGTATYDPASNTLWLTNFVYSGPGLLTNFIHRALYYEAHSPDFVIDVSGTNRLALVGAGVYVQSGTFNMSGGAIRFNRAVGESTILGTRMGRGGGVYVSNGTFNFSGGTIAGNEAGQYGGGIYVASTYSGHGAAVNLSGGATVAGNALDGAASNIYLEEGGTIAVAGALSGTAGVTMQTPGVFTSGLPGNGGAANFASDDPALAVSLADAGEAQLAEPAYPLWIGGARFTAGNLVIDADDDPGIASGTATFDPASNTLSLTNFVYSGAGHSWTVEPGTENEHTNAACIFYSGADTLAVSLSGTNSVALSAANPAPYSSYGFRSGNYKTAVSFAGAGSLSARAGAAENSSYGVDVRGPLAVAAGAEVAGAAGAARAPAASRPSEGSRSADASPEPAAPLRTPARASRATRWGRARSSSPKARPLPPRAAPRGSATASSPRP